MTSEASRNSAEDPLLLLSRIRTWAHSRWLSQTYPFAGIGKGVSIHHSCDISRTFAPEIRFGNDVYLAPDVWINIAPGNSANTPKIVIRDGCKIGRRSMISARNEIVFEEDVLTAPSVLVMDHNHEFADPETPIHAQGVTPGGTITIEKNCWLGCGAVIVCGKGNLRIGRNSVVAANAVVTRSFPAYSVIAGNPAKLIRRYDESHKEWLRVNE